MIKIQKHRLTCDCGDCKDAFPKKRFEAVWIAPEPEAPALSAKARVPIGDPAAKLEFKVWVTPDGRLANDWPGFPGTAGARVETARDPKGDLVITGTRDPVLTALTAAIPLRRALTDRVSARCTYELGLADIHITDYIPCELHGHGLPALTCRHVSEASDPIEVIAIYGVDGDYPDLLCPSCVSRVAQRDLSTTLTICSCCQQGHIYRHHISSWTYYGAKAAT